MSGPTPVRKFRPTRGQLAVLRMIEQHLDEIEANEVAMQAELKALNRRIDIALKSSARALANSRSS